MDLQLTNLSGFFHILHLYRMNIFHINWKQQRIAKQREPFKLNILQITKKHDPLLISISNSIICKLMCISFDCKK